MPERRHRTLNAGMACVVGAVKLCMQPNVIYTIPPGVRVMLRLRAEIDGSHTNICHLLQD